IGRSQPSLAVNKKIEQIVALGAEVLFLSADVADRVALEHAIAAVDTRFGAIHGIVHSAGVAGGGLMNRQTAESVAPVLAPKITGTRNLERALANLTLDFFVVFGSQRSIIGAPGRADYCAANAFLDAWAANASANAAFTASIAWDAWRDV